MKYHHLEPQFSSFSKNSSYQTFRNKLKPSNSSFNATLSSTANNLELSIKYFQKRIADYQKAINGASFFLNQLKSDKAEFDEVSRIYWSMAFDPCSKHSKDIFLSLESVYESLRDKFSSLELGD